MIERINLKRLEELRELQEVIYKNLRDGARELAEKSANSFFKPTIMKAAEKLKEIDEHMYYHLLHYKEKYSEDFEGLFGDATLDQLRGQSLVLWIGFVSGKVFMENERIISQISKL